MELTPLTVVAVSAAAFLIGFTKAGMGGGIGPITTAIMVLALPVDVALGLQLPMLIVGDAFAIGAHWRRWEWTHLRRLALGALPGVFVGTFILASVDATTIQRLIGVVSLMFVTYRIVQPRLARLAGVEASLALGVAAGGLGGVASAVAHAGSPPVSAYLLLARVTPVQYAAVHILLFASLNLLKIPGYVLAGFAHPELQLRLAPTLAFIPLGVVAGRWMVRRIPQVVFDRLILTVLTVTGFYLLLSL